MKSMRSVLLGTTLLGALIACADPATGPDPRSLRVSAFVGDPPPPPAATDGTGIGLLCIPDPGTPPGTVIDCVALSVPVGARILFDPQGNTGFIDFSALGPNVVVSGNARLRFLDGQVTASGTVRFPYPSESIPSILWNLSAVRVTFKENPREIWLKAPITDNGGPVMTFDSDVIRWYPEGWVVLKY